MTPQHDISKQAESGNISIPFLSQKGNYPFNVDIKYGSVPDYLETPIEQNPFFEISTNEFLLKIPEIAAFYVTNGEQIIVEKTKNRNHNEILLFLMDSVFAVLMHQKGLLSFRGTALEKDGKGILLGGSGGAGKSTLARELMSHNNFNLISDGHVFSDGKSFFSGFQMLTLWQDIVEYYSYGLKSLIRPRTKLNKFWVETNKLTKKEETEISAVYHLTQNKKQEYATMDITGAQKLKYLWNNTSYRRLAELMERKKKNFGVLAQLAGKINMKELAFYPKVEKEMDPGKLARIIINDFKK
ncbi:MAG: hypothetical protein K9I29_05535 [Bacteroidales bacterium]|nr:hypothetical protein [Bacteroidales bacterium]MCF8327737.1 hypothetical protein [Bacteroidales bacterium]